MRFQTANTSPFKASYGPIRLRIPDDITRNARRDETAIDFRMIAIVFRSLLGTDSDKKKFAAVVLINEPDD